MAWYDPRRILATLFTRTKIPIVVDGKINPTLLTLARRGYWFQSRVLHVPDSFGFFSSGPPLLQAHEAHIFFVSAADAVGPVVSISMMECLDLFDIKWWLQASMAAVTLLFVISVYVDEIFFNPMRASDYDWKARGKKMGLVHTPA